MAFALIQTKFLWFAELQWFAYIFGGVISALTVVQLLREDLTWADWVYFLGFLTPMTTAFVLMLANPTQILYVKANWYLGFFTFILGFLYYVAQSVLLVILYLELSNPPQDPAFTTAALAPLSKGTDIQTLLGYGSWAHQTYLALPDAVRIAMFQAKDVEVEPQPSYKTALDPTELNKDAITILWIYFVGLWLVFVVHGYFTLGLYSYYIKQKTV